MSATAISISLDEDLLAEVDRMVQAQRYGDRDQLVRDALREKLAREGQARPNRRGRVVPEHDLEAQAALLNVDEERAWAEMGVAEEAEQWPQY